MKVFHLPVFLLLFMSANAMAQESLSGSFNYGSIVIHTRKINMLPTEPAKGFTLNYAFPDSHGIKWRKYYNYPNYGLSYNYMSYNNPDILGHSHSLTGFFQISFLRKHKIIDIGFKGNMGIGFFTNKYDPVSNPLNPAISSYLNISTIGCLYSKIRFNGIFLEYALGLNHFSNGRISVPNYGLNILNNSFSLGVELEKENPDAKTLALEKPKRINHEFWAFSSVGLKEIDRDTKKCIYSGVSVNYSKQVSAINKIGIGVDLLNDPSLTSEAYKKNYHKGGSNLYFRSGFYLHNEFLVENFGVFTSFGMYLQKTDYDSSRKYYKVGFKYYFKNVIGMVVFRVIPLFKADGMEVGVGYRIAKYN